MEIQNKQNMKSCPFSIPVTFDGGLQSSVRADLINELLKYILFERQQIPFSLDQIKREVKLKASDPNCRSSAIMKRLEHKKALDLINSLDEIKRKLCHSFESCPEIQQVAFVLGATAMSPKEVFKIQLPPLNPEADNLPGKACIKTMFRQLIIQDPLREVKQISPTNISVLIHAPRQSDLPWFYPKPLYKLPVRGKQFEFSLQSQCGQGKHDLSSNFSIVELSGFEPFDSFIGDSDVMSDISEGSFSADFVCVDSDQDIVIVETNDVLDPTNPEENLSDNSTPKNSTGSGQDSHSQDRKKKSGSVSSVLSQTSVLSNSSRKIKSPLASSSQKTVNTDDTGIFSFTKSDFIWFQSPITIKGYKCKS